MDKKYGYRPNILSAKLAKKMRVVWAEKFQEKGMSLSEFYEYACGQFLLQENLATTDEVN